MARIVLANEMGGGWGHILPLRAFAAEFVRRGCEVSVICRDVEKANYAFPGKRVKIEQSPAWTLNKTGFSLNYAQNLWGNGYWDEEQLGFHFKWWSARLKTLKPDFVLADYSPTAILAAMSLDMPRGAFGTGFTLPPTAEPMPCLHPWFEIPAAALSGSEKTLLDAIKKFVPSVKSISGIFQGAERFLVVFPEMDHFECRQSEIYFGPVLESASDGELTWPDAAGCRVFIYLSHANRFLGKLAEHVRKLGVPAIAVIRGLPENERKAMESRTLRLSPSLVNVHRAASECDVAVTQGGFHTSAEMLLCGVRLLVCPEQLEQTLLAYRLHKRGLCEFVSLLSEPGEVAERFGKVVSSGELGRNVAAFASKHAGYDSSLTVKEIVRKCLKAV